MRRHISSRSSVSFSRMMRIVLMGALNRNEYGTQSSRGGDIFRKKLKGTWVTE